MQTRNAYEHLIIILHLCENHHQLCHRHCRACRCHLHSGIYFQLFVHYRRATNDCRHSEGLRIVQIFDLKFEMGIEAFVSDGEWTDEELRDYWVTGSAGGRQWSSMVIIGCYSFDECLARARRKLKCPFQWCAFTQRPTYLARVIRHYFTIACCSESMRMLIRGR